MSRRYSRSVITSSATAPTAGDASGMWTLDQALLYMGTNLWPVPPNAVDYLIVAGGGGGAAVGSGAGAGGLVYGSMSDISGTYTITVGGGGAGNPSSNSSPGSGGYGSNSSAFGITAYRGGPGITHGTTTGLDGGSGGGTATTTVAPASTAGRGVYPGSAYIDASRQGYDGGGPGTVNGSWSGLSGGGGGAGGPGGLPDGGVGYGSDISGAFQYYAGGGGAGAVYAAVGVGGSGIGGNGGTGVGGNGVSNTGSGGAGGKFFGTCGYNYCGGGNGGSGVVIVRAYKAATSTTGSPLYTVVSGFHIYKFTASGTITF